MQTAWAQTLFQNPTAKHLSVSAARFAVNNPTAFVLAIFLALLLLIVGISEFQLRSVSQHAELAPPSLSKDVITQQNSPNIVASYGRVKTVSLDSKHRWHTAWMFDEHSMGGFIAEILNQPGDTIVIGTAKRVTARVTLTDSEGAHTTADPAPWLNANVSSVRFEPGTARELLMAVFDHEPDHATGEVEGIIHAIRDQSESGADQRYESTAWLHGRVVAEIILTIDGVSKGPFKYGLEPGKPPTLQAQCRQIIPSSPRIGRLYVIRNWFRRNV